MSTTYTLHAPEASFRAFAALIAAEYNGIEIDIQTDLAAASKSPTGKLPLLEVTKKNGSVTRIFSAQAIARYIASVRRDTGLMGNGITAEASINAWVDFSAQDLELPACIWFYPVAGYMPFSQKAYEKAKTDLAAGLAVLEKHLSKQNYLVGDELTLADICVASVLIYPFKLVCDKAYLAPYSNVLKWFQACVQQDEFKAIIGQVILCKSETLAPGQSEATAPAPAPAPVTNNTPAPASAPAPAPAASEDMSDRRLVAMAIKPVDGVDPVALYNKIKKEITVAPEHNLKWDDECKVQDGKIYASFTIAAEAEYDEEVCEMIEMMEDEVAGQEVTFMNVFE